MSYWFRTPACLAPTCLTDHWIARTCLLGNRSDRPNRDLHSGHFGGAVANPINVLCQIIGKVTDAEGRITVPSFYDDVEEVPQAERDMIARIPFDEEKYKKAINVKALFGEKGYSTLERNSCRPSFDVCGIWGGYTGEGSKTVLPSKHTPRYPAG